MRRWRWLLCAALLAVRTVPAQQGLPLDEYLRLVSALPLPEPTLAAPPARGLDAAVQAKIDPRLRRQIAAAAAAGAARALASADLVPVRIFVSPAESVAAVKSEIARRGENTADFENTIWARVPADAIGELANLPAVVSVSAQPLHQTTQDGGQETRTVAPGGDGVRAAHFDVLHHAGIDGRGVRIGILDLGFSEYERLVRADKVKTAQAEKAFPANYGIHSHGVHGTACAEVIYAGAPGADLYLAAFDGTEGEMVAAARWLIGQGVRIINYSAGSVNTPNDGRDAVSAFLDATSQNEGVVWVTAAGNHAEQHWTGVVDPGSGPILLNGQKGLAVEALTTTLRIVVRWDDWGRDPRAPSATQDIDAYLYTVNQEGDLQQIDQSEDEQNGGAAEPLEEIDIRSTRPGRQYFLVLRAKHVTRQTRVHVFLDPGGAGRLFPDVAEGSILSPASARSALAAGAVDVIRNELAGYSSQGPTDDRRLKPNVVAPSNTVSFAYGGDGRFAGTSAAAPHVAAFCALLKQMHPDSSSSDLRTLAMAAALPRGKPHPNPVYGFGEIDGLAVGPGGSRNPSAGERPAAARSIPVR